MNASENAELNAHEIVAVFKRYKWPILAFVFVATAGTCIASFVFPKKYEAVILFSPVTNSSTNGLLSSLNSVMSQFSGLASLAGLSQAGDSTKSESLAVLESEALTEEYIRKNNLLPILFSDKWDSKTKTWKETDPKKIPTLWKGNQLFKKKIRTVSAEKSGLVSLTITWKDAKTAAKWANDLVELTNSYRREKAIKESEANIAFLNAEVVTTDVVGVRQAIFTIMQQEISKMMLARGNEEYALRILDPAVPSEKPSSPLPWLWTLLGFVISSVLSLGFVFFRAALEEPPSETTTGH